MSFELATVVAVDTLPVISPLKVPVVAETEPPDTFVAVVAVAALPVQEPELPDTLPVTLPVNAPVIVPATSAFPLISKEDASISPLALNITLSPPDTSKII